MSDFLLNPAWKLSSGKAGSVYGRTRHAAGEYFKYIKMKKVPETESLIKENESLRTELDGFRQNEKMFHALVETAVGDIGEDFFNNIVIKLAEWLNAECVIIGRLISENTVQGFPMYLDGRIVEDFTYQLQNTPCDLTSKKGYCVYTDNVGIHFPDSKDIRELDARGYVGTALYNKEGKPNGILCAMSRSSLDLPPQAEDILRIVGARITAEIERIKAQKKLEASEAALKSAINSKDRLFSIIAHDLKSPFNTLLGFSSLMLDGIKSEKYNKLEEFAQYIQNTSQSTYDLLRNLLAWSLAQTGQIDFLPKCLGVSQILLDGSDGLRSTAALKQISIENRCDADLEVYADRNMLETILRNLISNAIKYSYPGGSIRVDAFMENEEVRIDVVDEGIGIEAGNLEKLFNPDITVQTIGTKREQGTGLGLILCKDLAHIQSGRITVESTVGYGSKFSVFLPRPGQSIKLIARHEAPSKFTE